MIDLHSHILPQMDDGSKSVAMSVEMLRSYSERITDVCLTPHFYPGMDDPYRFLKRREAAMALLQPHLEPTFPKLHTGAEVAYFEGIKNCTDLQNFVLDGSRLLLIELPVGGWTERIFFDIERMADKHDVIPVLAHLDRYPLKKEALELVSNYLRQGGIVQLNASAFLDTFGFGKYMKMLETRFASLLGSDAHNMTSRKPNLDKALTKIEKKVGKEPLEMLERHHRKYFA